MIELQQWLGWSECCYKSFDVLSSCFSNWRIKNLPWKSGCWSNTSHAAINQVCKRSLAVWERSLWKYRRHKALAMRCTHRERLEVLWCRKYFYILNGSFWSSYGSSWLISSFRMWVWVKQVDCFFTPPSGCQGSAMKM